MASGLTISNLLYGILAGMKEGIDALSQTGPSEGQRMNKNSYLPFTRNAWGPWNSIHKQRLYHR